MTQSSNAPSRRNATSVNCKPPLPPMPGLSKRPLVVAKHRPLLYGLWSDKPPMAAYLKQRACLEYRAPLCAVGFGMGPQRRNIGAWLIYESSYGSARKP